AGCGALSLPRLVGRNPPAPTPPELRATPLPPPVELFIRVVDTAVRVLEAELHYSLVGAKLNNRGDRIPPNAAAPRMSRSAFLRASAGALLGSGLLLGAASPARADDVRSRALQVTKVADLTGPGLTTRFRMEATDLGIPVRTPDGRTLFVFGDSFEQAWVGGGWWRSPTALYSTTTDLASGVQWSGAVGG